MTSAIGRFGAFQWVPWLPIAIAGSALLSCSDGSDDAGGDAGATATEDVSTASSNHDGSEAGPDDDVSTDPSQTNAPVGNDNPDAGDESTGDGRTSEGDADASASPVDAGDVGTVLDAASAEHASDAESQSSSDASSPALDGGQLPAPADSGVCPAGESYYTPGCGVEPNPLNAGCYQACEGASDTSCREGTVCAVADINPCDCSNAPPGTTCCAACGAEVWLCQAASSTDSECSERPGRGNRECRRR